MANNNIQITVQTNAESAGKSFESLGSSISRSISRANSLDKSFKFLDAAFNAGKVDIQQYAKLTAQLDKEQTELYATLGRTTSNLKSQGAAATANATRMSGAAEAAERLTKRQRLAGKSTNRFGMFAQQVGYQVGDFAVQVQSGTNALVAFGQQGTQLAGLLPGLAGAVLGIGLSLGTALLGSQLKAKNLEIDFKKLGSAFIEAMEPIQPLLSAIGSALTSIGSAAKTSLGFISDNLARVITYGITAATVFGVKLVKGFVLAAAASGKFTETLRQGLIRTGIGALVVALGEVVFQFTRLVKASGGLSEALYLLGQIAKEVFFSIPTLMVYLKFQWGKIVADMVTSWVTGLKGMVGEIPKFVNKVIGAFKGAIDAVREIWLSLPDIFVEVFNLAVEKVKEGVQGFVEASLKGVNWLREKLGQEPIILKSLFETPDMKPTVNAISTAVGRAKEAFDSAMNEDYIPAGVNFLDGVISNLEMQSLKLGEIAKGALNEFKSSNPTLEKLISNMRQLEGAGFDVSSVFTEVAGKVEEGSAKAQEAVEGLKETFKSLNSTIESSMENGFMAMVEGTKSVKDAFKDMARDIIKELYRVLVVKRMVGSVGGGTGLAGMLGGGLSFNPFGGISFDGGGYTGSGPRSGGMDGRGGFLAMMHPNETVVDHTKAGSSTEGNVTVVQNFHFQANGDESVKKIIAQMAPSIASMAKQSVVDARRRGGAMKNAFG
jgi:methyl-accepting chemotaxis protein